MVMNTRGALILLSFVVSNVWGSGPTTCTVELTRDDAIELLAEASVRAANNLSLESVLDTSAVNEAKRKVSAQFRDGWAIRYAEQSDCTVLMFFHKADMPGSGILVRADAKKRLVGFLPHR